MLRLLTKNSEKTTLLTNHFEDVLNPLKYS